MTEADATRRPLQMPEKFLSYLEKHRLYVLFKDMLCDLIINLPRDHLKHIKIFMSRNLHSTKDTDRVILLISPELKIDVKRLVKALIKDVGFFVFTRRCVMDRYEKEQKIRRYADDGHLVTHVSPQYGIFYRCVRYFRFAHVLRFHRADNVYVTVGKMSLIYCAAPNKHDDYVPGCISPALMSTVTKLMTMRDPVITVGWLFFDHPCTVREARCLQQDGVLPTVTLVLMPPPPLAPPAYDHNTPARPFFQQDFEGLKFVYKATLKEVHVEPNEDDMEKIASRCFNAIRACASGAQGPGLTFGSCCNPASTEVHVEPNEDDMEKIASRCFNAIRACASGAQGPGQGFHAVGAPGVYRVILIGPMGSGRKTQARLLARHFGLVYLNFNDIYNEAKEKMDDVGEKLRNYGSSVQLRAEVVKRRVMLKDCVDNGWVLTGYPSAGIDFEYLDNMPVSPNRIIILNADWQTCKTRALAVGVDRCSGKRVPVGSSKRVVPHPGYTEAEIEYEIEYYFTEALAELRAAAGITAVEISAKEGIDEVQVKIQAAVIAAPEFDIECCLQLRNVRGE